MVLICILFFIPILIGFLPFFIRSQNRRKRNQWLLLTISNELFYWTPVIWSIYKASKTEYGFLHSNGGGAALVLYLLVWPLTIAFAIAIYLTKRASEKIH